jgi:hypothetical protein
MSGLLTPWRDPLPVSSNPSQGPQQTGAAGGARGQPSPAAGGVRSNVTPRMSGVAHPGISDELSRADHVHDTASAGARTGRLAVAVAEFFVVDVSGYPIAPGLGTPPLGIISSASGGSYDSTPGLSPPPGGWTFAGASPCLYNNTTGGDRSATLTVSGYYWNDNGWSYVLGADGTTDGMGYIHYLSPSIQGPGPALTGFSFTQRLIVRAGTTMSLSLYMQL